MESAATAFGRGLGSLVAILDPDIVVVGGGVGAIGEAFLEPARRAMMSATPGRNIAGRHRSLPPGSEQMPDWWEPRWRREVEHDGTAPVEDRARRHSAVGQAALSTGA